MPSCLIFVGAHCHIKNIIVHILVDIIFLSEIVKLITGTKSFLKFKESTFYFLKITSMSIDSVKCPFKY